MPVNTIFTDLNIIEYKDAWDYQENLFNKILENKKNQQPTTSYLLFCEHPHVYTLGKSGEINNLLINEQFLKSINATFYKTNRGGDITYHGFGQVVGYPIFDLEIFNLQAKQYIYNLEEVIILTLKDYGIECDRLEGATGVWIDATIKQKARKICAIGVRMSRFVTMHGFALNVNTDLSYFNHINPCGFVDKGVTSMEKELGRKIDFSEIKNLLKQKFEQVFNLSLKT